MTHSLAFLSPYLKSRRRTKIIIGDATSFTKNCCFLFCCTPYGYHSGTVRVFTAQAQQYTSTDCLLSWDLTLLCRRDVSITEIHFNFSVDFQLNSWKSSGRVEKLEEFTLDSKGKSGKSWKTRNQRALQWFTLFETVWNVLSDHHSHCWISTEWSSVLERDHLDFLRIVFSHLLSNQTL